MTAKVNEFEATFEDAWKAFMTSVLKVCESELRREKTLPEELGGDFIRSLSEELTSKGVIKALKEALRDGIREDERNMIAYDFLVRELVLFNQAVEDDEDDADTGGQGGRVSQAKTIKESIENLIDLDKIKRKWVKKLFMILNEFLTIIGSRI